MRLKHFKTPLLHNLPPHFKGAWSESDYILRGGGGSFECISLYTFSWVILAYLLFTIFQVKMWVKELRKMLGNAVQLCIVGNKIDKEKERHVAAAAAEE